MKKLILFSTILSIILLFSMQCSDEDSGESGTDYNALVSIAGGTYTQTDGSEIFVHKVSDFRISRYEVTYELWHTVYQWAVLNGYTFESAGMEGSVGTIGAAPTASKNEPVTLINWRDAIVWCNAYSEKSGLSPCYYYPAPADIIKDSTDAAVCDSASCDWTANGYRLPTEGEWQYAAANNGLTPYSYVSGDSAPYDTSTAIDNFAWYDANSDNSTNETGIKSANQLGIYDMSGNVYEWCWDKFDNYPAGMEEDYRGSSSGSSRIVRGGGWESGPIALQVGVRDGCSPGIGLTNIGFRIAKYD